MSTRQRGVGPAITALAVAAASVAAIPAVAGAAPITDHDGRVHERHGSLAFTDPKVEYRADDSSYGKVLRITWTVRNDSDAWVKSMGTAHSAAGAAYVDAEGEEMLFHCLDAAVPFAPGTVATCDQYRLVTPAEEKVGYTAPDVPRYRVLYGIDSERGEYAWSTAAAVPSVDLPGGATPPGAGEPSDGPDQPADGADGAEGSSLPELPSSSKLPDPSALTAAIAPLTAQVLDFADRLLGTTPAAPVVDALRGILSAIGLADAK